MTARCTRGISCAITAVHQYQSKDDWRALNRYFKTEASQNCPLLLGLSSILLNAMVNFSWDHTKQHGRTPFYLTLFTLICSQEPLRIDATGLMQIYPVLRFKTTRIRRAYSFGKLPVDAAEFPIHEMTGFIAG